MISFSPRGLRGSLIAVVATVTLGSVGIACGDDGDDTSDGPGATSDVVVADAWIREPAEGQTNSAMYAEITNAGGSEVVLVAATTPITDRAELHETLMDDDGVMRMQERTEGFVIAAGDTFVLEPGGAHVMLFEVDADALGSSADVTLDFDGADPVTVTAEVRSIDADPGMDMDPDMDMDMDDDMDTDDDA